MAVNLLLSATYYFLQPLIIHQSVLKIRRVVYVFQEYVFCHLQIHILLQRTNEQQCFHRGLWGNHNSTDSVIQTDGVETGEVPVGCSKFGAM